VLRLWARTNLCPVGRRGLLCVSAVIGLGTAWLGAAPVQGSVHSRSRLRSSARGGVGGRCAFDPSTPRALPKQRSAGPCWQPVTEAPEAVVLAVQSPLSAGATARQWQA